MKKIYNLASKNIAFILFLIPFVTNAISYHTIKNGDWNNGGTWSTDGGSTTCNCSPGIFTNGNNIYIRHHINLTNNITVNGGSEFIVLYSSSLSSPVRSITAIENSYLLFLSPVQLNKLTNGSGKLVGVPGARIDIHHILEINGQIDIYAGEVNLIGGYINMLQGNFHVAQNGTFTTSNGAKLELFVGNIDNYGHILICSDCCIETIGNWTNHSIGTVLGSGSALTNNGNIKNFNTLPSFSSDITWCSAGNDFGMPSNEDCSSSTLTCGIVQLPTEISKFDGYNYSEFNEIIWTTDSENNCDYFSVQKSVNGFDWIEIDNQKAAGNSIERIAYSSKDYNIRQMTYYRLEQVDLNGDFYRTPPISVTKKSNHEALNIYPNPTILSESVYISGIEDGSSLLINNNKGQNIKSLIIKKNNENRFKITTTGLTPGVYFIEVMNINNEAQHKKLIIR